MGRCKKEAMNTPNYHILLAGCLLSLLSAPSPRLFATAGFEGHYRPGSWVQVRVEVNNPGPAFEATVEAVGEDATRYAQPISVAAGGSAIAQLYVPLDWTRNRLPVRLRRGGTIVAESEANLQPLIPGERLIGVIGASTASERIMAFLKSALTPRGHGQVIELSPGDLPAEALAWDSLDVLIVSSDLALTRAQRTALQTWVEFGGQLLMAGVIPSDMAELAPAQILGSTAPSAPSALSLYAPTDPPPGPLRVLRLLPDTEADVILSQGDLPLIIRSHLGRGSVLVIAFAVSDLAGWEGRANLWSSLTAAPVNQPPWAGGISGWTSAHQALWTLPDYPLPSVGLIAGFSLLYAVLAGPVNLALLTRLRRRGWAWATVTGLSVLFSLGAWAIGQTFHGNKVVVHRLAVVQVPPGAMRGRADVLIGVFAPRRGNYSLQTESILIRPLIIPHSSARSLFPPLIPSTTATSPPLIHQTEIGTAPNLRLDVGEFAGFTMAATSPVPPVSGEVQLDLSDVPRAVGWVQNDGHAALEDAVLIAERGFAPLGSLAPGERRAFSVVLEVAAPSTQMTTSASPHETGLTAWSTGATQRYAIRYVPLIERILGTKDYWAQPQVTRRFLLLSALLAEHGSLPPADRPTGISLVGWQADAPVQVKVKSGASRAESDTLYIYELAAQGPPAGDRMNVPAALMRWQILDPGTVADPTPYSLYLQNQAVVFRFQPWPAAVPAEVGGLRLHLGPGVFSGQPTPLPAVALRNWRTGAWETLQPLAWGQNEIHDLESYVGPDGVIDAQIAAGAEPVSLLRFEFSLTGSR